MDIYIFLAFWIIIDTAKPELDNRNRFRDNARRNARSGSDVMSDLLEKSLWLLIQPTGVLDLM